METQNIPCVRELNDYHAQVKDISAYSDFHANELRVNRRDLLNSVKKAQELRCFTSLRTCYFLKLTPANAPNIAKLPFMRPNGCSISDRLVEMSGIGSVRSSINKFIKTVFSNKEDLTASLATLDFNSFPETVPYLPEGIKSKDFFACSTVPALFGHFWTTELKENFLKFIFQVGDKIPNISPSTFREHWLFDCIKYYVFSSDVNKFLRISIGDIIFKLLRDQDIQRLARSGITQELLDKLCEYANEMLNRMTEKISIFPDDVKSIVKHFYDYATTDEERLSWLEIMFIECILAASILNPRNCGIIPPTFYMDPILNFPLSLLAQIMRLVLHPTHIKVRYPNINSDNITKLPLQTFLMSIISDISNVEFQGPKLTDLLPLLGIHYILLLLSLPDVYLLADAVKNIPNPDPYILKDAQNIPTDEPIAFEFFRFDVWDFNSFGFKKPKIPEIEIEKTPKNPASLAGEALYKFLSYAEVDKKAPNGYSAFSEYHERNMIRQKQYIVEAYLRHLYVIHQNVPEKDKRAVIPGLEDEIRRHLELEKRNDDALTGIAIQMRILNKEIDKYESIRNESMPILYSQLLVHYMEEFKTENILEITRGRGVEFIMQSPSFVNHFKEFRTRLFSFLNPFADYSVGGVACCLHSLMMQILTFSNFVNYSNGIPQLNEKLNAYLPQVINQLCVLKATPRVKDLLYKQELFLFSITQITLGFSMEIPLETLRQLAVAVELCEQMFELEIGEPPTNNELKILFFYALLNSRYLYLYSMGKYLQHFLTKLDVRDNYLFNDKMLNTLSMFNELNTEIEYLNLP